MNRVFYYRLIFIALLGIAGGLASWAAAPSTVAIQGTLIGMDGLPLSGTRLWRVQYYDAQTGGSTLGSAVGGILDVASSGRWSASLVPPSAVLSASGEVWYELAIDSAATPDGAIDVEDVFSQRVKVESALFAQNTGNIGSVLTGPITFYVSPSGNDGGDGSAENPWATPLHALQAVKQYDLNGHPVTIQLADGIYRSSVQSYGPFRGQTLGPTQVTFLGNMESPENVVVSPPLDSGYCFSAAFGASFALRGIKMHNPDGHYDTLSVGQFGSISIANVIFGYNNYLPITAVNDVSVSFTGRLYIDGDYTIGASDMTFQTTASFAAGSTQITVADPSNIKYIMGVTGSQFAPGTYVSVPPTGGQTIRIWPPTTGSGSNVPVTFTAGKQCHIDLGNGGVCHFNSNGVPGGIKVTIVGSPYYHSGFFYDNGLCIVNVQNVSFINGENVQGTPFFDRGKSTLNTGDQGVPYIPGSLYVTRTANVTAGSKTITLSSASGISVGNAVNGCVSPTATFGAGATSISVSSGNFIQPGNHITGPGIDGGTTVKSVSGSTIELSHPTASAQSGVTLRFKGIGVANGTYVTAINNRTITLSIPVVSSQTSLPLWFGGSIQTGAQFM